jgi:cytochrome c oxidase subunit IV
MTMLCNDVKKNIDQWIFIKNGHSFLKHIIPFSLASILLILISISPDNILRKMVDQLSKPSRIWIPGIILTVVSTVVYYFTIQGEIRMSYITTKISFKKTAMTCLLFISLCSSMTYFVFMSILKSCSFGLMWACTLTSVVSLNGMGWSLPKSLVETFNIQAVDYRRAHQCVKDMAELLSIIRKKPSADANDVNVFIKKARELYSELDKNVNLEAHWAKSDIDSLKAKIQEMILYTEKYFTKMPSTRSFPAACKGEILCPYPGFFETLKDLGQHWPSWDIPEKRRKQ